MAMDEAVRTDAGVAAGLLERFRAVRAATVEFVEPLTGEDQMVQSCAEASPTKWHLAHTSWFFETFCLREFLPGYEAFHPEFHWLFNSYYNSLGEMPEKKLRASFSRPGLETIRGYRAYVDAAVERMLEGDVGDEALRRVALGLEHEQQHLELIATDIKHALWTNPLKPVYREDLPEATAKAIADSSAALRKDNTGELPHDHKDRLWDDKRGEMRFLRFEGGVTEIGVSPDAGDVAAFAFDNETPRHRVFLEPYALANRLVTCAEYLEFLNDNGYSRPELWLSEGWGTMRASGWQAPLYWKRDPEAASGWSVYTLRGFRRLEDVAETPVCHVSLFEADAFARWMGGKEKGCRLPTEFEWESAVAASGAGCGTMLETGALHPVAARGEGGIEQALGDVWEWTASGYTGYPGYHPLPGALGEYNGKFMSSQVILRGGSCVTPASHIRATYRNFFPPGTRWQFSGIRLAKDGL